MEQNTTLIQLPFNGGLDEKTAPEWLAPGSFQAQVLNGVFNKNGTIDKRLGAKKLGTTILPNNFVQDSFGSSPPTRVAYSKRTGMCAFNARALYNHATASDALSGINYVPNVVCKRREVDVDPGSPSQAYCDFGSLRMAAFIGAATTYPTVTIYDRNTGEIVMQPTVLASTVSAGIISVFLVGGGTKVAVVYFRISGGGTAGVYTAIYTIATNTFNAPVASVITAIGSAADAAQFVGDPSGGFLVATSVVGGGTATLTYCSSNGSPVSSYTDTAAAGVTGKFISCCGNYAEHIYLMYGWIVAGTRTTRAVALDSALALQHQTTVCTSTSATDTITAIARVGPNRFQFQVLTAQGPSTGSAYIGSVGSTVYYNYDGTGFSQVYWPLGYVPVGKPVVDTNGDVYTPCALCPQGLNAGSLQNTLCLMKSSETRTPAAVCTVAPRQVNYSAYSTQYGTFGSVPCMSCGTPVGLPSVAAMGTLIRTDDLIATSSFTAEFQFGSPLLFNSSEVADGLHVASGVPFVFDGGSTMEEGFLYYPEGVWAGVKTGTWLNATGTYQYAFVYRRVDSAGNVQRSSPWFLPNSTPLTNGANQAPVWNIPVYSASFGNNVSGTKVYADIYRTIGAAGSTLYYVGSVDASPPGAIGTFGGFVAYNDTSVDSSINTNTILYTTGGVLDNINPPSSTVQCTYRGRIFRVDETGKTIWFSQVATPGEAPGWNEALTFACAEGGDITALAAMDDKLVIFKTDSVWIVTGDGPSQTGQGSDLTTPQKIAADVGALDWRSVALMPKGLMFQARAGVYLLGRDLTVTFIGKNVQDTLATYSTVTSAVLVPAQQHVRFTCVNAAGTAHVVVMYDYLQDAWSTAQYGRLPAFNTIPSACLVGDQWTFMGSGGTLFQERLSTDASAYQDDNTGAVPGFVTTSVTTPWIHLDGLQGYQRARRFLFDGNPYNNTGLSFSVYTNHDPITVQQYETFLNGQGELSFHLGAALNKQQAIKLAISDIPPSGAATGNGNGYRFVSLALEVQKIGLRNRKFAVGTTFAVTALSPATGNTAGGDIVLAYGAGLTNVTSVKINGVACTGVVALNDYTLQFTTPAGAAGAQPTSFTSSTKGTTAGPSFTYASAVPTLASVLSNVGAWAVGDIAGGYPVTLTGTNFTGATGVTFGGTAATAVVVVNPTTITCTVPAHATGAVSVIVTTPGGSNTANTLWRFYSPAQESLGGWWRNFANPTTPTASAGSSGANGNLAPGVAPTFGTLNTHPDAIFNGTTQFLQGANAPGTYVSLGAGDLFVLAFVAAAPTPSGTPYLDPNLLATTASVEIGATLSATAGVGAFVAHIFDGAHRDTASVPFSLGAWHLFRMSWDSAHLTAQVDGTAGTPLAAGAIDTFAPCPTLVVGCNYNSSAFLNGNIAEVIAAPAVLGAPNDIRAYFATRYGVNV